MAWAFCGALLLSWVMALSAIALGRNLTRSLAAAYVSVAVAIVVLAWSGGGLVAWCVGLSTLAGLATIQVVGWMLVDVDHDHLPPTERPTLFARSLAFAILAGAFGLLFWVLLPELAVDETRGHAAARVSVDSLGALFFGDLREEMILLGMAVGGSLLSVLGLLREDGEA